MTNTKPQEWDAAEFLLTAMQSDPRFDDFSLGSEENQAKVAKLLHALRALLSAVDNKNVEETCNYVIEVSECLSLRE